MTTLTLTLKVFSEKIYIPISTYLASANRFLASLRNSRHILNYLQDEWTASSLLAYVDVSSGCSFLVPIQWSCNCCSITVRAIHRHSCHLIQGHLLRRWSHLIRLRCPPRPAALGFDSAIVSAKNHSDDEANESKQDDN